MFNPPPGTTEKKMRTKSIDQMEAQFGRVARMFWQINAEMELTEVWTNRLTRMAAALSRYRKNAYAYIFDRHKNGLDTGAHWEEYHVPASIYAKQV